MNDKSEIQHLPAPADTRDQLSKDNRGLIARGRQDLVKLLATERDERDSRDERVYEKLSPTEIDAVLREAGNYIQRGDNLTSEELFNRGETFFSADGVPQDYAEAIVWFRRAAERHNVKAMVRLGEMYYMGWGVPEDYAASFGWYQKAAEQEYAVGQFWLGYSYRNGIGTKRDDAQAIIWELRSAEQGYARAQSWLGTVYLGYGEGFGVPRDPQESYFWSYLAHEFYAAKNNSVLAESAARKRDRAASFLTDAALTQTQDRAKLWLAAHRFNTND